MELVAGGSGEQTPTEFFQRFRCCDRVWKLVPVFDCSREKEVPVDLTGGSLMVELGASTGSTVFTLYVFLLFHIY